MKTQMPLFAYALLVVALQVMPEVARADYFIRGEGKKQPFCEAILSALNSSNPSNESRPCISDVILKIPGVQDPDWTKLDLSQHEELAMEMMTLNAVGSQEYFREKKLAPDMYPTAEGKRRMLEYVKQGRAEMFALKLVPNLYGDKVLVTLLYRSALCGWPTSVEGENYYAAWVTSDLKEIATGPGLFNSTAGRPLVYRERLYLTRPYGSARSLEAFVPRQNYMTSICRIDFSYLPKAQGEAK